MIFENHTGLKILLVLPETDCASNSPEELLQITGGFLDFTSNLGVRVCRLGAGTAAYLLHFET